jgi:hypothetical protein
MSQKLNDFFPVRRTVQAPKYLNEFDTRGATKPLRKQRARRQALSPSPSPSVVSSASSSPSFDGSGRNRRAGGKTKFKNLHADFRVQKMVNCEIYRVRTSPGCYRLFQFREEAIHFANQLDAINQKEQFPELPLEDDIISALFDLVEDNHAKTPSPKPPPPPVLLCPKWTKQPSPKKLLPPPPPVPPLPPDTSITDLMCDETINDIADAPQSPPPINRHRIFCKLPLSRPLSFSFKARQRSVRL